MSVTLPWVSIATALRRVCGAATLLGLFAMHGVAVHGAIHSGHSTHSLPAAVAIAGDDRHHHGTGDAAMADTRDDAPSGTSQERTPDPELLGFAGLCLAMLIVIVVAVASLSRFIGLRRRRDSTTAPGWPSRSRRDRDPPGLFALSIQRC
jgi:hypothetical protein